ncbi:TonB-dependent receptor [Parvularcula sp. LCG005]|uniref:TonB-dependent receptor n=1 Tax=Parvularcula sp. LCG005 TaxID=3078805 RepID=UPI0029427D61|nr:TonB-dependent receptor [Parvularcula sp. LCG005]WOI53432.1 TonB-dependent receptor [Parvularcula sp. LCG005]
MGKTSKMMGAAALALTTAFAGGAMTIGASALAQDATSGALVGNVTTDGGSPIQGASVTLRSNDRGFTRTATTNAAGNYRLPQLPVGTYTVTINASGYEGVTNENVRIVISSTADFSASLVGMSGPGDEIIVTGQARSISAFDANTTGLTLDVGELASKVPVQRDIQSVALLAPGATLTDSAFTAGTNRGGSGTQIGISGASVGENQFFVNGFNISDFNDFIGASVLPFEFYENVEVKTGGTSAEFGRATGGFVNATTKSGSNEFKASVNMYWAPDELREQGKSTYNYGFDATKPFNRGDIEPRNANYLDQTDEFETNISVSGPLIEDKLFYYVLLNLNNDSQTDVLNHTGFVEKTDDPTYAGKIDYFLTDTQHFEYTFFKDEQTYFTDYYDTSVDGSGFDTGLADYRNTAELTNGGSNHIFKYSGQWTDWLTLSASYGTGENANSTSAIDPAVFAATDVNTGERLTPYAVGIFETTLNERDAYRIDADLYFDFIGEHQLRLGWDREDLAASFDDRYPGAEVYTLDLPGSASDVRGAYANPDVAGQYLLDTRGGFVQVQSYNTDGSIANFRIRSRIAGAAFETQNEAFYVQDAWNIHPNVSLNLGVRFETFQNANAEGEVFYETDTLTSPRLGVNFDALGDGTLQFSGFYGRYYLPIATNTNFRLAGNERDVRANYTAGPGFDLNDIIDEDGRVKNATYRGSTTVFSDGFIKGTEETVSTNLQPQYVDEFIASVNHVVTEGSPFYAGGLLDGWELGLSYTHRELYDALEDAAVDFAVNEYCAEQGLTGCESVWSGFHHYVLINPGNDIEYSTDDAPVSSDGSFVPLSIDGSFLPEAERVYDAVSLTFERPDDGKWSLRGNYTWSDLEGNYEGSVKSDNGQTDAGLTQDFDQPGLVDNSYGKLPQHREHQFKVWGSYNVTDRLRVGANYQLSSPRQFGCIGVHPTEQFAALYDVASWYCIPQGFDASTDPTGNGFAYTPLPLFGAPDAASLGLPANTQEAASVSVATPRGSQLESDWLNNVNLSMAFTPPVADDRLTLRVDVFNVFNGQAVTDIEEEGEFGTSFDAVYASPNYGLARGYQAPRSVRLGLELDF